jgi:hypothetical protein
MAPYRSRPWQSLHVERAIAPELLAAWGWVEQAEELIEAALLARGVNPRRITEAYACAENDPELEDAAAELSLFVEALGGRLELDPISRRPVGAGFSHLRVELPPFPG